MLIRILDEDKKQEYEFECDDFTYAKKEIQEIQQELMDDYYCGKFHVILDVGSFIIGEDEEGTVEITKEEFFFPSE